MQAAYLSGIVGSSTVHDSNTLDTFADESVNISKSEYDSLIQKMHSVSTSDNATLTHSDISYLASSSLLFSIIDPGASTRMIDKSTYFFNFQDNSRKCTNCNRINHTIDRCWELHGKPSWPSRVAYLFDIVGSFTAYNYNTLDTSADKSVTISKSEYDSLIQKIYSVFTSDITTLPHPGISCLASSSPSSSIIDSDL